MQHDKTAKASEASRGWLRALRRRPAAVQTDFADHGTAFGLELSLTQSMLDDQLLPMEQRAPAAQRPGWMQRMAARRRHAE